MGTLFSYSLGSGIFLILGFIVYRFLMAGEKQPGLNRAAIIGLYAASLSALPLMSLVRSVQPVPAAPVPAINIGQIAATIASDDSAEPSTLSRLLLWIYLLGVAVVLIYSAICFIRLALLIHRGRRVRREGYTLIVLPEKCVPFSFASYIVMGEADAASDNSMITTHELGHLSHHHWLDLLLAQGVCALMWYNPAAWLTRRELRRVHEYQADSAVISRGVNLREYQMLLIEKAAGVRLQSIANSLDHSNLSKRITMMYKQTNRASRRLRTLALAPALLLAAVAVNSPAVASALSAASETTLTQAKATDATTTKATAKKSSEKQFKIVGKKAAKIATPASAGKITQKSDEQQKAVAVMPEYPGGMNGLIKFLVVNIHYPEAAIKAKAQGRVVVQFVVKADGSVTDPEIIRGLTPELDAEALRVVGAMPRWIPGKNEKGEPVSCHFAVPIDFALSGDDKTDKDAMEEVEAASLNLNSPKDAPEAYETPAYFIDGKPFTGSISEIQPDRIKSITVKKDDPAYPNGQIFIELK